jgi:hypothetical protein
MKKSIIVLSALLTMHFALPAQNVKETQTLSDSLKSVKIGFVISPYYQYTQIDKVGVSIIGLRGGIVFNDKLSVGAFYSMSINEFVPASETDTRVYMDYRAGGGFLEYTLWSHKLAHLTIPLFIGAGHVEMDWKDDYADNSEYLYGDRSFFIIEPSACLEINLHKIIRFDIGLGYRIASNMTYRNFDQSALMGFTANIGLKVGIFELSKK